MGTRSTYMYIYIYIYMHVCSGPTRGVDLAIITQFDTTMKDSLLSQLIGSPISRQALHIIYTYICIHVQTYIYICIYICVFVCMYIYIFMCICMYMYTVDIICEYTRYILDLYIYIYTFYVRMHIQTCGCIMCVVEFVL